MMKSRSTPHRVRTTFGEAARLIVRKWRRYFFYGLLVTVLLMIGLGLTTKTP